MNFLVQRSEMFRTPFIETAAYLSNSATKNRLTELEIRPHSRNQEQIDHLDQCRFQVFLCNDLRSISEPRRASLWSFTGPLSQR